MAVAVAEKQTEAPLSRNCRLAANAGGLIEQFRRWWFFRAPEGADKEAPLYPEFWAAVGRRLARHDMITLLAPDESWEMECCVEKTLGDAGAVVTVRKVHSRHGIVPTMTEVAPGIHSEWKPELGWCIVRQKDQVILERGHGLEATAIAQWRAKQPRPVV